jgi:hypothetical protein
MNLKTVIDYIILLFCVLLLWEGVQHFMQSRDSFSDLKPHRGTVEQAWLTMVYRSAEDSNLVAKIKLSGEEALYNVSQFPERVENLVHPGDSITLLTMPLTGDGGNFTGNGKGSIWATTDSNEVYHFATNRYDTPILHYEEHRRNLKNTVWAWPLASLIFFGWFLYRRSGRKSPLVMEHGTIEL